MNERLCLFCGCDISHKCLGAIYCKPEHKNQARKYRKANRLTPYARRIGGPAVEAQRVSEKKYNAELRAVENFLYSRRDYAKYVQLGSPYRQLIQKFLLEEQSGKCLFCHEPLLTNQKWAVDHRHSAVSEDDSYPKGRVRGLIHSACNIVLNRYEIVIEALLSVPNQDLINAIIYIVLAFETERRSRTIERGIIDGARVARLLSKSGQRS